MPEGNPPGEAGGSRSCVDEFIKQRRSYAGFWLTGWIKRRPFLGSRLRFRRGILHRGRSSATDFVLNRLPPVLRRRHDQLENHEPRRVLRERAFHARRAGRTVAKALSIGFGVRRCVQCSAGKSKNLNNASRSLRRQSTALSPLGAYFWAKAVIAASAAARFSESQSSRRSRGALG